MIGGTKIVTWKRRTLLDLPLIVSIFLTIASQVEGIPFHNIIRLSMYIAWPVLGLYYFAIRKVRVTKQDFLLAIPAFLVSSIGLLLSAYVHGYNLPDEIMKLYLLATSLLILGKIIARSCISESSRRFAVGTYVILASMLAVVIVSQVWSGFSGWLSQSKYLYDSKNSASQILACATILLLATKQERTIVKRLLRWLVVSWLLFAMLYIQARATLVGLFLSTILGYLVFSEQTCRHKALTIFGLLFLFLVTVLTIPEVSNVFNKVFRLNEGSGFSINTFSSSRVIKYKEALAMWRSSPLIGVGDGYVDNFVINLLMNGGILFLSLIAVPVYCILIITPYKCASKGSAHPKLNRVTFSLSIFFLVVSFFEAYAPLGPGACSFVLWLLLGYRYEIEKPLTQKRGADVCGAKV